MLYPAVPIPPPPPGLATLAKRIGLGLAVAIPAFSARGVTFVNNAQTPCTLVLTMADRPVILKVTGGDEKEPAHSQPIKTGQFQVPARGGCLWVSSAQGGPANTVHFDLLDRPGGTALGSLVYWEAPVGAQAKVPNSLAEAWGYFDSSALDGSTCRLIYHRPDACELREGTAADQAEEAQRLATQAARSREALIKAERQRKAAAEAAERPRQAQAERERQAQAERERQMALTESDQQRLELQRQRQAIADYVERTRGAAAAEPKSSTPFPR